MPKPIATPAGFISVFLGDERELVEMKYAMDNGQLAKQAKINLWIGMASGFYYTYKIQILLVFTSLFLKPSLDLRVNDVALCSRERFDYAFLSVVFHERGGSLNKTSWVHSFSPLFMPRKNPFFPTYLVVSSQAISNTIWLIIVPLHQRLSGFVIEPSNFRGLVWVRINASWTWMDPSIHE